jgi:protein-tyrosine phosphatase
MSTSRPSEPAAPGWGSSELAEPRGVESAVLMVCMGNICRSPMAAVVARAIASRKWPGELQGDQAGFLKRLVFDSAGTLAHHTGAKTDSRANAVLLRHGYGPSEHRSRRVQVRDFERFDLVLAMDRANLYELQRHCPAALSFKLRLFLDFAPGTPEREVPDPYYGSVQGFERVLELCEAGATGLVDAYRAEGWMPQDMQVGTGIL